MRAAALALSIFFALNVPRAQGENPFVAHLVEAAQADYKSGHLDSALTKLDEREKTEGTSGEALDLRGSIALEQGRLETAQKAFTAAHTLAPDFFAPRLHLGDLLLREKNYAAARAIYQQLSTETTVLISSERLRFALLIVALATHDEEASKSSLENIKFPTETPAYYYAQAAWEFAHGNPRSAHQWIDTAGEIFEPQLLAWFARPLYDLGWLKEKPPPATL
jgi:tetratricopeptide (TPR) repeat protein